MAEVHRAIKESDRNSAPGLDGIPVKILKLAPVEYLESLDCFTVCLRSGTFPSIWKRAKLVLIPKGITPEGEKPKVRPICLLMDTAKLLERIVAGRINAWMAESEEAALSEDQYGFVPRRSTCDALNRLRDTAEAEDGVSRGRRSPGRILASISRTRSTPSHGRLLETRWLGRNSRIT